MVTLENSPSLSQDVKLEILRQLTSLPRLWVVVVVVVAGILYHLARGPTSLPARPIMRALFWSGVLLLVFKAVIAPTRGTRSLVFRKGSAFFVSQSRIFNRPQYQLFSFIQQLESFQDLVWIFVDFLIVPYNLVQLVQLCL